MSEGAKVDSIDALKAFKGAIWKFVESVNGALGDAEAELGRTLMWLETEQDNYWRGQIRLRTDALAKAKEALRGKKMYKDASGRVPSAVEEEKAVALAMRRLAEAEEKLANVRKYRGLLQKEISMYKGAVQKFATTVQSDLPAASGRLEGMIASLEAYVSLASGRGASPPGPPAEQTGTMAQAEAQAPEEDPAPADEAPTGREESSPNSPGQGA